MFTVLYIRKMGVLWKLEKSRKEKCGIGGCFGWCKNCILYAVGLCRVYTMVLIRSLRRSSLFDQYMEDRFIKIMWRQVVVLGSVLVIGRGRFCPMGQVGNLRLLIEMRKPELMRGPDGLRIKKKLTLHCSRVLCLLGMWKDEMLKSFFFFLVFKLGIWSFINGDKDVCKDGLYKMGMGLYSNRLGIYCKVKSTKNKLT